MGGSRYRFVEVFKQLKSRDPEVAKKVLELVRILASRNEPFLHDVKE